MQIKRQSIAFNILNNFSEVNEVNSVDKTVDIINDNFNKGLIDELELEEAFEQLDNIIQKAAPHKYFKREGTPGNYKYYYTEAEYRKAKGTSKESDSKLEHNIVDDVNNGEIINSLFKEWDSIRTTEQHEKWAKKVANTKFGTYKEKTILNVIDSFNPKFRNEIVKNDFLNEVKRAYDSYEEKTVESTKESDSSYIVKLK